MIFKQWEQVLDGTKSMTRRLVQDHELALHQLPGYEELPIEIVMGHGVFGRLKWKVGQTYAVQPGRGKKAVGRIRITAIHREQLQNISHQDIIAEGIGMVEASNILPEVARALMKEMFIELWDSINKRKGTRFADNPDVWVLSFQLVSPEER